MSNNDDDGRSIDDIALEWLLRMEDPSPQERAQYWDWVNQSPLHVQAVLKAKASLAAIAQQTAGRHYDQGTRNPQPAQTRVSGLNRPVWKIAAGIAFLAVAVALILVSSFEVASDRVVDTEPSEWETIRLADGTVVQAGPLTQLSTEFTDGRRTVRLDRGEAMFRVAKDPERPFIVETDRATARAVGTAFAVSLLDSKGAVVTVEEGVVEVARRTGSAIADKPIRVEAGQQVQVTVTEAVPLIANSVNVQKKLAWVTGWFAFETETVAEAAREYNLRNRVQIRIEDEAIAGRTVVGVFDAAKPHSFAAFLERSGRASVDREDPDTLVLVPHRGTEQ